MVEKHRSTQRHGGKVIELEEVTFRRRLQEISADHIRWGRRMAPRLLLREGWTVTNKLYPRAKPWHERIEPFRRPWPTGQSADLLLRKCLLKGLFQSFTIWLRRWHQSEILSSPPALPT